MQVVCLSSLEHMTAQQTLLRIQRTVKPVMFSCPSVMVILLDKSDLNPENS